MIHVNNIKYKHYLKNNLNVFNFVNYSQTYAYFNIEMYVVNII